MDSYATLMPVFAVKASRTFWKFACSAPPHRDVTVIEPLVAPEPPGAVLSVPVLPAEDQHCRNRQRDQTRKLGHLASSLQTMASVGPTPVPGLAPE
jgi:hypothetical protein